MRFENDPFSVWTPKTETFENASHSFVERLLNTMALWHSNSRLVPSWQLLTKGIVLKKWLKTPFCWSNVNAYRFHSVFIWKRSNVNGQRFHQQKRIETKTEQCERMHTKIWRFEINRYIRTYLLLINNTKNSSKWVMPMRSRHFIGSKPTELKGCC